MKARLTLTVLILIGVALHAPQSAFVQQTRDKAKATKSAAVDEKKNNEIENFIMYAQAVPAEFSADLFIQLAESGEIKDAKRKQDLLVEAFQTASKAKEPLRVVALPGSAVDSRGGYRAAAARAGLDTLSLQCRTIKALLPLNAKEARRLFTEIKLKSNAVDCESTLAYQVDCFFSTLEAVANAAFSAEEMERGEHVYFVEQYISKLNSANQIGPAIKTIVSLKTTDLELANLGRAFSAALQKIPPDDRTFSAPWNTTMGSIDELVTKFNQRGLPGDEMIESYRTYLVNQLSGSRCADTAGKQRADLERRIVAQFNSRLLSASYKKIAPISDDEIKPAQRVGAAKHEPYWTSAKAKSILLQVKRLRFNAAGKEVDEQSKQTAEWQSQLSQMVRDIAAWGAEDEKSEEDYFHQKSVIYQTLFKLIPIDKQHEGLLDEATRDFATMLAGSALQKEKPAEWFLHARVLIDRVNNADPAARQKLVNLINSSRSNVLHLYVQRQELFKTK